MYRKEKENQMSYYVERILTIEKPLFGLQTVDSIDLLISYK